jgi:hypothetical protein
VFEFWFFTNHDYTEVIPETEFVSCSILPLRTGTRMKLLRHWLIDTKTTYLVGDGQVHFRHTFNGCVTRSTSRASPGPRSTSMAFVNIVS